MKMSATELYRNPGKVFAQAEKGEVTIERLGVEYVLTRRRAKGTALYGSLRGSIVSDEGKAKVRWKAMK